MAALGRTLLIELDTEALFERLLSAACQLTGARYAGLGVLSAEQDRLSRFVTHGLADPAADERDPPAGQGVLGRLVDGSRGTRPQDVREHLAGHGFPAGDPTLAVPIVVRGKPWGNLYLTAEVGGCFDEADERAAAALADWAAIAIENARLYELSESNRAGLEAALSSLETIRDINAAVGGETDLERVLELIVERGRTLVQARSLVIMLREGDELVVGASAGDVRDARGARLPIDGSTAGTALERRESERVTNVGAELLVAPEHLGVSDAQTALIVPLIYRGRRLGVLAAFDHGPVGGAFTAADERTLRSFAVSAATAVALAQSVVSSRLRDSLAAAEAERRRWARELHDETLQALGALRLLIAQGLRDDDPAVLRSVAEESLTHLDAEIENLHAIITELRPASLDQLGLGPALESLIARVSERKDLDVVAHVVLPERSGPRAGSGELETTVYRLVQESLANTADHAGAHQVRVSVVQTVGAMTVEIADDGTGFDTDAPTSGFGLTGMRERVELAGGELTISSDPNGTTVAAWLPTE